MCAVVNAQQHPYLDDGQTSSNVTAKQTIIWAEEICDPELGQTAQAIVEPEQFPTLLARDRASGIDSIAWLMKTPKHSHQFVGKRRRSKTNQSFCAQWGKLFSVFVVVGLGNLVLLHCMTIHAKTTIDAIAANVVKRAATNFRLALHQERWTVATGAAVVDPWPSHNHLKHLPASLPRKLSVETQPLQQPQLDDGDIYAVLVTGSMLPGLQALAASLRRANTSHPLYVLHTEPTSGDLQRTAKCLGLHLKQIPSITNPYHGEARYRDVFNKLEVWRMNARQVVLLDADMVVLKNIDDLFSPGPSFRAAPDHGILELPGMNTGLMVINPSNNVYNSMRSQLGKLRAYDGGDQGFLQTYFAELWNNRSEPDVHLPTFYNTLKRQEVYQSFNISTVGVIHNVGAKPWTHPREDDDKYPRSHGAFWEAYDYFEQQCGSTMRLRGSNESE